MPTDLSMYYSYDAGGRYRYDYKPSRTGGIATPKMKMIADLKALGLKDKEVHKCVKKPSSTAYGQAICSFKKDKLIMERTNSEIEKMVGQAKDIIKRASLRAAQNYEAAVEDGDLKASGKVLDLCGAFSKVTDVNVNIGFGQWLKGVQNRDDVMNTVGHVKTIEMGAHDVSEIHEIEDMLPEPLTREKPGNSERELEPGTSRIEMHDFA